jgi:hypothetical protein
MKASTLIFGATALLLAPSATFAAPGGNGSTSNGSVNGTGYNHYNGPATTGQPDQNCEALGPDATPGNSSTAPGSAFNPDGTSGSMYAGSQSQNSRNTASVSQYDVACANQPI